MYRIPLVVCNGLRIVAQERSGNSSSIMEGLQGMTPMQQQDFLQHLERQQVCGFVQQIYCVLQLLGCMLVDCCLSVSQSPSRRTQQP